MKNKKYSRGIPGPGGGGFQDPGGGMGGGFIPGPEGGPGGIPPGGGTGGGGTLPENTHFKNELTV